jgi:hypothetical protein
MRGRNTVAFRELGFSDLQRQGCEESLLLASRLPALPDLHLGEQFGEALVQRLRNPVEVDDTDVALAPLDSAHVGPVEPRLLCESLLAVAPRVA